MTDDSRLKVLPQQLPRPRDARTLRARPEEFPLAPRETALIVVDMQNAYASPGGYIDIQGFDVSGAKLVIERILRVIATARALGSPIIFFQNGWDPARHEAGTPDSPNWWKSNALKLMRADPKLDGTLITRGTWDYELVAELEPAPEDIILNKTRYSGFWGTPLDAMLRARRIRNLLFVGIATNVCLESILGDAYFLEYFPILIKDAALHAGPAEMQAATVFNVGRVGNFLRLFCHVLNLRQRWTARGSRTIVNQNSMQSGLKPFEVRLISPIRCGIPSNIGPGAVIGAMLIVPNLSLDSW